MGVGAGLVEEFGGDLQGRVGQVLGPLDDLGVEVEDATSEGTQIAPESVLHLKTGVGAPGAAASHERGAGQFREFVATVRRRGNQQGLELVNSGRSPAVSSVTDRSLDTTRSDGCLD